MICFQHVARHWPLDAGRRGNRPQDSSNAILRCAPGEHEIFTNEYRKAAVDLDLHCLTNLFPGFTF
jgi:hypothetical protein